MRKALLVVALLGGSLVAAPPAHPITSVGGMFVAHVSVAGGLGYPVPATFSVTPNPSYPSAVAGGTRPFPPPFTITGAPTRAFNWATSACATKSFNFNKAGKDPFFPSVSCSLVSAGVVTGFCGLATGTGAGLYTGVSPISNTVQAISFAYSFVAVGGTASITGTWWKSNGQTGPMQGEVALIPVPSMVGGPSCTNGTQMDFVMVGGRA